MQKKHARLLGCKGCLDRFKALLQSADMELRINVLPLYFPCYTSVYQTSRTGSKLRESGPVAVPSIPWETELLAPAQISLDAGVARSTDFSGLCRTGSTLFLCRESPSLVLFLAPTTSPNLKHSIPCSESDWIGKERNYTLRNAGMSGHPYTENKETAHRTRCVCAASFDGSKRSCKEVRVHWIPHPLVEFLAVWRLCPATHILESSGFLDTIIAGKSEVSLKTADVVHHHNRWHWGVFRSLLPVGCCISAEKA